MTTLQKIISFPSNATKVKICIHEKMSMFNTSVRNMGGPPGFGGLEGDLLQVIVSALGVGTEYYIPDDNGFSVRSENNIWGGCPGMVQRGEVDFAIGGFVRNHWRNLVGHQSPSYRTEDIRFVTKKPQPHTSPEVIIKTFDGNLWLAILMSIFFMSFVYYWVQGKKYTFVEQFFSRASELLMQEPLTKIKRVFVEELLCLCWTVSIQFISLAYMAVILGVMMTPRRDPDIDTDDKVSEAVKQGRCRVGTNYYSQTIYGMLSSSHSKYRELGNIMVKNNWIFLINESNFVSLLEDGYALTMTYLFRTYLTPPGYETVLSRDIVARADLAILSSRSWPLKKKLDVIINRMVEHGIHIRDHEHFSFKGRLKLLMGTKLESNHGIRALSVSDLQGTFILLGIGLGVATIALIFEIIAFKRNKKKRETAVPEIDLQSTDEENIDPNIYNKQIEEIEQIGLSNTQRNVADFDRNIFDENEQVGPKN